MSIFGQGSSAPLSTGSSLFPTLNLNTTTDQSGRKRSIFDPPASTTESQPQPPKISFSFDPTSTSASSNLSGTTAVPSIFSSSSTGGNTPFPSFAGATPSSLPISTTTAFPTFSINQPSMFSGSTANNPTAGTSTFAATAQPGNQRDPSSQQQDTPGQSQARDPAYFSGLLERQKKKVRFTGAGQNGKLNQVPNLNLDLGDLARRASEFGTRSAKATSASGTDSRAHYLLAGSGVSPGKAFKDFQAIDDAAKADEAMPSRDVTDHSDSKYIRDLQQKGREEMMRESMDRVYREVDAFIVESLGIDFEEQKQRIMEHFGLVPKDEGEAGGDSRASPARKGTFGRSARKSNNAFADGAGSSTRSVFGRSALDKSMIGTPGMTVNTASFFGDERSTQGSGGLLKGQIARDLRDKERLYLEKVQLLNEARLKAVPFPIMDHFAQVEELAGGESVRQLTEAYRALQEIAKEKPSTAEQLESDPSAIRERQYASTYLDENANSPRAIRFKRQILGGSLAFLEKSFFRELESLIEKNTREAQLGGRPSVMNKVRAYIRVRSARRDLAPDGAELQQIGENGDYCWVLIFFLLRSGHLQEAVDYVNNDPAFQSTDKRFISYLTAYGNSSERRLSRKLQEMISNEYVQRLKIGPKQSLDPYRMACYKIVGRCDLSQRNLDSVGQGVEDWIWLQFSLARECERIEELSGEIFGLDQICETVAEIGRKHFPKAQAESSGGYGIYFFMQILAGMFEQAVDYLHSFSPVSAVHCAIALSYYGLLRVSDCAVAGNELLTYSTTQLPLINFVPLVAYHTATFRTALPVAAVDYLSLICLNSDLSPANLGSVQTAACHECLRQLCLETREFAKLLGDIRSDGTRIPGAIEQRAKLIRLETHEEFLKAVTMQAAAIANERGQIADAVLLYHLCEDYDNVIGILNRSLADAVTLDLGESPLQFQPLKPRQQEDQQDDSKTRRQDGPQSSLSLTQSTSSPLELAKNMISLYNENAAYYNRISVANRDTCGALIQLLTARSYLEAKPPRYMAALEVINDLNLLPLRANGSIPVIRAAASAFGSLPQILARCAGVSVVWAVRAIGGERENIIKHGSWDGGSRGDREGMKEQLSSMAKDLMVFAGLVKYKLPGRVYDLLTKAGGDVGMY